jgi:hypothetical protein
MKKILFAIFILLMSSFVADAAFKRDVYDYQGSHLRQKVNYSLLDSDNITVDNILGGNGTFDFLYGDGRNITNIGESATTKTTRNAVYRDTTAGDKCDALYLSGASGDKPEVMLTNNQEHFSSHMWGILGEDAVFGDEIFVRLLGDVSKDDNQDDCDTSGFVAGCNLHITDIPGKLNCSIPQNGSHVHAGIASKINANTGIVEAAPQPYVHDIRGTLENEVVLACGSGNFSFVAIEDYNGALVGVFNCSNNVFSWVGSVETVNITVLNPPVECPAGTYMTQWQGNQSVCVNGNGTWNSLAWNRSGTDVFLANTGDNVGIGTDAPTGLLDIHEGQVYMTADGVDQKFTNNFPATAAGGIGILNQNQGGVEFFGVTETTTLPLRFLGVSGASGATSVPNFKFEAYKSDGGDPATLTTLGNDDKVMQILNGATELVTIMGDGDVGLGTSTPSATLEVNGAIRLSGGETLSAGEAGIYNSSTTGLSFQSGTGSISDWSLLDVNGNFIAWVKDNNMNFGTQASSVLNYGASASEHNFIGDFVNITDNLYVGGNVGIQTNITGAPLSLPNDTAIGLGGTTTPKALIEYNSTDTTISVDLTSDTDFRIINSSGEHIFFVDETNNVPMSGYLGKEKITNGDFSSATGWTGDGAGGWLVGGGVVNRSTGAQGNFEQTSANMVTPLVIGESYLLSFDIASVDTGYMTEVTCGGQTVFGSTNKEGTSSAIFTATSTANLKFDPQNNNVALVLDNVSLKRIIRKDFIVTNKLGVGREPTVGVDVYAGTDSVGIRVTGGGQTTPKFEFCSDPVTSVGATCSFLRYDGSNTWWEVGAGAWKLSTGYPMLWGAAAQGSLNRFDGTGFVASFREGITLTTTRKINLGDDSIIHEYGTGNNATVYYNGNDFVISPQLEGGAGQIITGGAITVGDMSNLGSEFVTEGDFSASCASWTSTGWTCDGTDAVHDTGNTNPLSQTISGLTVGKLYRLKFTTAESIKFNGLTITWNGYNQVMSVSDFRTVSVIVRATATSNLLSFTPTSTTLVAIDDVSIQELGYGDLNAGNVTINMIYGSMYNYSDAASPWTFPIAASGVYYNLTNLSAGRLNGFTFTSNNQSTGGSFLTVQVAGEYKADASVSWLASIAGGNYGFAIVNNYDVTNNRQCYARREATGNVGNVGMTCTMTLAVGDKINIQVEDETAPARDISIHTVSIALHRIGN